MGISFIKKASGLFIINGTIGILPIAVCMLLSEFLPDPTAIYISIITSICFSALLYFLIGFGGSPILSSASTLLLILLGISTFIPAISIPKGMLPFYAEIGVIIFVSILLYERRKIKKLILRVNSSRYDENVMHSINSGAIYSRLIQLLCIPHFIITSLFIIFGSPLGPRTSLILLHILPPTILISAIIISQIGLSMLYSLARRVDNIPVLNEKGEVIDKKYSFEAYYYKNRYLNPVIRIAVISNGLMFLSRRPEKFNYNPGKIDLPMETYLQYEEKPEDGVKRILRKYFPENEELDPRFSIKYRFKNEETNRLIYLYILYVEDDSQLCNPRFQDGKLWTIQQIESNLNKGYFGDCFEDEYEQLKDAVMLSEEFK